ncbi:MAG TPA: hypothetical protein VHW60_11620 [Caulobacteraceae bacterium]|nr:hypothetical protein [Caulobacteraceae bacterium]
MVVGAGGVGGGDLFGHGWRSPPRWAGGRGRRRQCAVHGEYVGYTEFDGETRGASGHNALYLSTRVALAPFGALLQR